MDAAKNKDYVANGLPAFQQKALAVQRETGVVRQDVDLSKLMDPRFVA
jgi:NitT/TauT family transport system substrate-binding protein